MKIRKVIHRGLRRFIERDDASGLSPSVVEKVRNIVTFLQEMEDAKELQDVPSWKVHQLAGDRREHGASRSPATGALHSGSTEPKERYSTSITRTTTEGDKTMIRMARPAHPGQFIRMEILEPLELSVTRAANILGVSRPALSALLNGRTALSSDMALRIEKAFGPKIDTLLRMQTAYDIAEARDREGDIKVERYVAKPHTKEPTPLST